MRIAVSLFAISLWLVFALVAESSHHHWMQEATSDAKVVARHLHSRQTNQQCIENDFGVSETCNNTLFQLVLEGSVGLQPPDLQALETLCTDSCGGTIYNAILDICTETDLAELLAKLCSRNGGDLCAVLRTRINMGALNESCLSIFESDGEVCNQGCSDAVQRILNTFGCCGSPDTIINESGSNTAEIIYSACSTLVPSPCPNPFSAATVATASSMLAVGYFLA